MSLADDINNLSFKNIGVWPVPIKIGSMLILFALLVLGGYWFLWKDQLEELDQSQQKEKTLRAEFLDKKQQAVNLDVYRQQVVEIEQAFGYYANYQTSRKWKPCLQTSTKQVSDVV